MFDWRIECWLSAAGYFMYTATILRVPTSTEGLPIACHSITLHCTLLGEPLDALLGTVTPHVDFFRTYHMA
jgi:hypothetical protein